MKEENSVIEPREVTKDIFNRLNDINRKIMLFDSYDNSRIAIDGELLDIITNYYKSKLIF